MVKINKRNIDNFLDSNMFASIILELYPESRQGEHKGRYTHAVRKFNKLFPNSDELFIFSSPGRTELGGNHTDHNGGIVLAAVIDLDIIAVVSPRNDTTVVLYSEDYREPCIVNIGDTKIHPEEKGKTEALIRGIASRIKEKRYKTGGFNAYCISNVKVGSGLSSSASFELLISTVFNRLFNNCSIPTIELCHISQYAENVFFGKPCGLMDQISIAYGGIVGIDFKDFSNPLITNIKTDFPEKGYGLFIVNTGKGHESLTDEYASITAEMKSVAGYFNRDVLRGITLGQLIENVKSLTIIFGDRAFLRTYHFIMENSRVLKQIEALKNRNFDLFLRLVKESGDSSQKWLQNSFNPSDSASQQLNIALALSEAVIGRDGAYRVHGGGFSGTIQVYIRDFLVDKYTSFIENLFGKNSISPIKIRNMGVVCINDMPEH